MNLFPFRKADDLSTVTDGSLYACPLFCRKMHEKCMDFYNSIPDEDNEIRLCPYGFCVHKTKIKETNCFNIGLSITPYSTTRAIERKLQKRETLVHLTEKQYRALLEVSANAHHLEHEVADAVNKAEEANRLAIERKQLIEDTYHEVRKINDQIKSTLETLQDDLQTEEKHILDIIQTMYGNSNLLSIRLDFYDFTANPGLWLVAAKTDTPIYRKFDKVNKCLYHDKVKHNVNLLLDGNSYCYFPANKMLEIGIFIILENAIKYSPEYETVLVHFNENSWNKTLVVTVTNWGPALEAGEHNKIFERGYRGRNAAVNPSKKGQGIGLHMLKQICDANSIEVKIDTKGFRYFQQSKYSSFEVKLIFKNVLF